MAAAVGGHASGWRAGHRLLAREHCEHCAVLTRHGLASCRGAPATPSKCGCGAPTQRACGSWRRRGTPRPPLLSRRAPPCCAPSLYVQFATQRLRSDGDHGGGAKGEVDLNVQFSCYESGGHTGD